MKNFLVIAVFVVMAAACTQSVSKDALAVRSEIEASLQRTVNATMAKDIDAYMAELPPDLKIYDESGAVVAREQQRANVLRDWSVIQETISLSHTVDRLTVQGETATVLTSQRWERRMLRPDGATVDTVLTTQKHAETWRKYSGRWYGYDIKELGGEIYINGEPYRPEKRTSKP